MTGNRIDYHLHTELCNHAEGSIQEYAEQAHKLGLKEIAFSDHIPMEHPILSPFCMKQEELAGYVESILELKQEWKMLFYLQISSLVFQVIVICLNLPLPHRWDVWFLPVQIEHIMGRNHDSNNS